MMAVVRSLLVFFMIFSMGNAKDEKCPYGWKNFGVRCYKFFPQSVNWIIAERNCQMLDGNLASVHSKSENDFLLSLVPESTRAWIGSHDGEQDGQWLWTDGSPNDHTNWCSTEPNNNRGVPENCAEINLSVNRCWNDEACTTGMSYICAINL